MLTPPPTDIGICLITRPRSGDGRSGLRSSLQTLVSSVECAKTLPIINTVTEYN